MTAEDEEILMQRILTAVRKYLSAARSTTAGSTSPGVLDAMAK